MNNPSATPWPEAACAYSRALAARSEAFRRQVERDEREADLSGGSIDPFGERGSACPGLTQRYPDRILVMAARSCFANCRHCTRRWTLRGAEIVETDAGLERCVAYAKARPEVRDVLISGGDPLTLDDDGVMRFVDAFAALDSIDVVRVCTRAPCTNPPRVTDALAARLGKCGKVWVNTQFNHADELTPEAAAACRRLVSAGIPVSCQTVLLAGVNDSAGALLDLFRALQRARVRPYYVFSCDPVAGTAHFRVPLEKARAIERECASRIGGLALPRFVSDVPGAPRKMPLDLL